MHSAIYQGFLRHRRFTPHQHRFSYRVFMMYLDLDELDEVLSMSPFWSKRRWRPARFQRSDFLGDPAVPLKQAVCDRIHEETGQRHLGRVPAITASTTRITCNTSSPRSPIPPGTSARATCCDVIRNNAISVLVSASACMFRPLIR